MIPFESPAIVGSSSCPDDVGSAGDFSGHAGSATGVARKARSELLPAPQQRPKYLPVIAQPKFRKKRNARIFKSGRTNTDLEKDLGFRLRLLQAKATATFLPLPTLLEEINALKALQDIALRGNLAGTLKRCMLAHFFLPFNR